MDLAILEWIQTHLSSPLFDNIFKVITALGDHGLIWILLCLVLFAYKKTRWFALVMGGVLLVELGLVEGFIKIIVGRVRPFIAHDFPIIISPPSGSSFPSGHSASSFAAATYLFMRYKKEGTLALVLAALIAFSRLYLFVHYPSDVFVGSLLGIILGLIGSFVYKKWFKAKDILIDNRVTYEHLK